MTLEQSASRAVLPWRSIDAQTPLFDALPQQKIDICLMCPYHADACDKCDGNRNLKEKSKGRPKAEIDYTLLREMMKLKRANKDICKALEISIGTLKKIKRGLREEMMI